MFFFNLWIICVCCFVSVFEFRSASRSFSSSLIVFLWDLEIVCVLCLLFCLLWMYCIFFLVVWWWDYIWCFFLNFCLWVLIYWVEIEVWRVWCYFLCIVLCFCVFVVWVWCSCVGMVLGVLVLCDGGVVCCVCEMWCGNVCCVWVWLLWSVLLWWYFVV